jgi:predicted membrane-bound spermidine synthase
LALSVVLFALFMSGTAGVANQVLWQRALKVFLGGSESISALVVVLVFMLGLGVGAGWLGTRASRVRHPIRLLALIELLLFVVNISLAWVLSLDLSHTVYAFERVAVAAGIPLRLVYASGSLAILLPPTLLMGATLPIASEACQRQLGASRSSLIAVLFFINTLGAALGAFGSSFRLLPYYGQSVSLGTAAAFNLAAAAALLALATRVPGAALGERAPRWSTMESLRIEEVLGAWLGFLSLGYEMYLFRVMSLLYEPLPYTFATTLCLFLLFWSCGVFAAARFRERLGVGLVACAALILIIPWFHSLAGQDVQSHILGLGLSYFAPCVFFGFLYGSLVSRSARQWGSDVGRFYALNTLGSCLGILFFTLVGYEIRHDLNEILISLGLLALLAHVSAAERASGRWKHLLLGARWGVAAIAAAVLVSGLSTPYTRSGDGLTFWGRDGVVEVRSDGAIHIDGLWHSRLSDGKNHVGRPYSWMMAFAGVFAHRDTPISDVLIVGNCVGITASTIAKLPDVRVDAYEINHTLKAVLEKFPEETLRVADNPKIEIHWQDARTGMALNLKKYDIIISAPLHLRQAGSSLLLSKEYMQLVQSRLKRHGVFVMYSHEGVPAQAVLIQRTVRAVFEHTRTFLGGLVTVASDSPIDISRELILSRLTREDPFRREAAELHRRRRAGGRGLETTLDQRSIHVGRDGYLITDDHPLVEYPAIADRLLREE